MKTSATLKLVAAAALVAAGGAAQAQQITLKVHHFLPSTSSSQVKLIQPWCDKIQKESKDRRSLVVSCGLQHSQSALE
mgnify:CR=1 FL=1